MMRASDVVRSLKLDDGISRFFPNQAHDVLKATQRPSSLKRYPNPISLDPPITRSKAPVNCLPSKCGVSTKARVGPSVPVPEIGASKGLHSFPQEQSTSHLLGGLLSVPQSTFINHPSGKAGVSDFTLTRVCLSLSLSLSSFNYFQSIDVCRFGQQKMSPRRPATSPISNSSSLRTWTWSCLRHPSATGTGTPPPPVRQGGKGHSSPTGTSTRWLLTILPAR